MNSLTQSKKTTILTYWRLLLMFASSASLLWFASGCDGRGKTDISELGGPKAAGVDVFNCTALNGGRAFNIYARTQGGQWLNKGQLNTFKGADVDCHDKANNGVGAAVVKVDFGNQTGGWEIRAYKMPNGEETCNSSGPEVEVASPCAYLSFFFQGDPSAPWATKDLFDSM